MHFYRTKEKHVLNVMPISLIYMQRDALNVDMNLINRQLPEPSEFVRSTRAGSAVCDLSLISWIAITSYVRMMSASTSITSGLDAFEMPNICIECTDT